MIINDICNLQSNRQTFGWNPKTHSFLTKTAIENFPELTPYSKLLSLGTQHADTRVKYTSLIGNYSHEYFGEGVLNYDIIPQNAFDMFHDNLISTSRFLRANMIKLGMYKAGITLHFLQDMSVPLHTKSECADWSKIIKHILYEKKAKNYTDLIKEFIPSTQEHTNFYDSFLETYNKSSQMNNPYEIKDKSLIAESVKESLYNAYDATYHFIQRLSKTINSQNKGMLIVNDYFEFIRK